GQADLSEILKIVAGEKAKMMYDKGDLDAGIISCGQGVGMVHDILSVKELFDGIIAQATDIVKNLSGN
ncbi:MAG: nitronate monooxygenase, partial [Deltaproteobacteria bacterium]|nr:nitronate monooxygenase [Deltaproteobacteria bacterium]